MKIVTAILSVYLLLLTVLPCCSFDNCPEDQEKQQDIACVENPHEGGDNDGCGSCSPFFNCHHCSGFNFTAKQSAVKVQPELLAGASPVPAIDQSLLSSYRASIWQPPRLG